MQFLGIGAVGVGVWRGRELAGLAAAGGIAFAIGWTIRWRPGRLRRRGPPPLGLPEVLDLIRQAYGASAAWAAGLSDGPVEVLSVPDPTSQERRRGAAVVQLASVDGRLQLVRDPDGTCVAVGDPP